MHLPANVTYRQFDHWVARGWINAIGAGGGPGSQRDLTIQENDVLCIMGDLVEAGMRPEQASAIARELHENRQAKLGKYFLRRDP